MMENERVVWRNFRRESFITLACNSYLFVHSFISATTIFPFEFTERLYMPPTGERGQSIAPPLCFIPLGSY